MDEKRGAAPKPQQKPVTQPKPGNQPKPMPQQKPVTGPSKPAPSGASGERPCY